MILLCDVPFYASNQSFFLNSEDNGSGFSPHALSVGGCKSTIEDNFSTVDLSLRLLNPHEFEARANKCCLDNHADHPEKKCVLRPSNNQVLDKCV